MDESGTLLRCCTGNRTVGSNPTPSATMEPVTDGVCRCVVEFEGREERSNLLSCVNDPAPSRSEEDPTISTNGKSPSGDFLFVLVGFEAALRVWVFPALACV